MGDFSGSEGKHGIKARILVEWIVMISVIVSVVYFLAGEGSLLRGSITQSGTYQYGYSYDPVYGYGYSDRPHSERRYEYLIGNNSQRGEVILDGLSAQTPQYRLDNPERANFHWEIDDLNPLCVSNSEVRPRDCEFANRRVLYQYFLVPEQVGTYIFRLVFEDNRLGDFTLATYTVYVVSAVMDSADSNDDGILDKRDLIYLLQHWNNFPVVNSERARREGFDVTNVLAVLVSQCIDCRAVRR